LFAPHKTPNFNISEVRMKRGDQQEVIIQNFMPSEFILESLIR
jgi:aminopeptidase